MDDKALFESTHQALTFAFNMRPQSSMGIYKLGDIEAWQKAGEGKGLGGLNGAAQSGMILAMVDRMDKRMHSQLIVAKFAPHTNPCACKSPCCIGYRHNPAYLHALMYIADEIGPRALSGMTSNTYGLRRDLVHKHFGQLTTIQKIAEDNGVHRDTVAAAWAKVNKYLKDEAHQADCMITDVLQQAGIVSFAEIPAEATAN